jgi:hypothetical protein
MACESNQKSVTHADLTVNGLVCVDIGVSKIEKGTSVAVRLM